MLHISNFHELQIAIENGLISYEDAQELEDMLFQKQVDCMIDDQKLTYA